MNFLATAHPIKRSEPITAYGSFPSGVNSFYSSISGPDKLNKIPPTTIKFNIDPAFVDSLIVDPLSTETNTVPMGPRDGHQNSSWGSRGIAKSRTEQIFPIQSGTNINSVIDRIMRKSDYITSQIKDFNTARKTLQDGDNLDEFKFLNWYKVIPEVNLGRYDDGVQAYAYEITYNVVQYRTANTKHPDFAKTRITKDNIVRTYNYRYTGKNIDVIDLDINFDTAFYTAMTAFPKNKALAGGAIIDKRKSADPQFNEQNNAAPGATTQGNPVQLTATGGGSGGGQFNRTSDFKSVTVDDLAQSIYSSSAGDMLSIQLKIIGDPAFIKQDDIFYNPSRNGYKEYISFLKSGLPINKSGQIVFDTNQVYVQLLVHSATDIDDTVGIVNPNKIITLSSGNSIDSTFSGAYQVLTVETTLNEGQFEQDLHIIKIPNFLTDKVTNNSVTTEWSNYLAPGASDDNAVSAPPVQVVSDALGIQGNDMSKLVAASNSDPDGVFPIVNGAGTTPAPQQVTESSPANINDSVAFNGQLVNTQTG